MDQLAVQVFPSGDGRENTRFRTFDYIATKVNSGSWR